MTPLSQRPEQAGAAFQQALDLMHRMYERDQVALILRNETASRVIGRGGDARVQQLQSMPDYFGWVVDGPPVVFDAKTTARSIWHLPRRCAHQFEALERAARFGALAFFLIEIRPARVTRIARVFAGSPYLIYWEVGPNADGLYDWISAAHERWPELWWKEQRSVEALEAVR